VTLLPGKADFLGYMYAFGAMLSFTIAHLSVIRLRATKPDVERPYRGPGNVRVRGYDLPLFAVFGAFGTTVAFGVTVALHPEVAAAGFGWLALGVVVYFVYRRRQGLDLASTHKVAIAQPVVDHEAEYDSVLVPLLDGRFDEHVLATAVKLAARKRRGIHVVALVTVPQALPIDAPMSDAEAAADSVIEQARIQAGRRVSGHREKIRPGQAGRRIVDEARDMRAAAIVLAMPPRVTGGSLFGKTIETVLAERPCRVVIETQPPANGARPR
jgi:APA family basic amino acid/polyamine antiporter